MDKNFIATLKSDGLKWFPKLYWHQFENTCKDTSCKLSLSKLSSSELNSVSYRISNFPLWFIACLFGLGPWKLSGKKTWSVASIENMVNNCRYVFYLWVQIVGGDSNSNNLLNLVNLTVKYDLLIRPMLTNWEMSQYILMVDLMINTLTVSLFGYLVGCCVFHLARENWHWGKVCKSSRRSCWEN